MSADPADWVTDGYGCLRMIRILADAYGFLSVSIRSYRKWPCDCTIKVCRKCPNTPLVCNQLRMTTYLSPNEHLFVLRFYGPDNLIGSFRVWSVYLTTLILSSLVL